MATVTTGIVREFKDLDLNFTIHPVKKDINKHVGTMAIVNSIKNLVLTNHYEVPFHPEIGSNTRRLLFENLDTVTAAAVEAEIRTTITNFEPRVNILNIQVLPDYDKNGFKVYLEFSVVNLTQPVTINFFLERIR
jgi:phage baseplate assembly protein W